MTFCSNPARPSRGGLKKSSGRLSFTRSVLVCDRGSNSTYSKPILTPVRTSSRRVLSTSSSVR